MNRVLWSGLLLVSVLAGCGSNPSRYWQLQVGKGWSYAVRAPLLMRVESVKVTRTLSVAGNQGFELAGGLGVSRVAWKDGRMVAESLPGMRFYPAITFFHPNSGVKSSDWKGLVMIDGRLVNATARLTHAEESVDVGSRKVVALRALLTIDLPSGQIEVASSFSPEFGLIRQTERHDGKLWMDATLVAEE